MARGKCGILAVPRTVPVSRDVGCGYGYIGARNDTTQQSEQTADKELKSKTLLLMSAATLKPLLL
jgi:hypothetical protein